jgi:predicted  nucleic acid-binding Zn-ribbon protein
MSNHPFVQFINLVNLDKAIHALDLQKKTVENRAINLDKTFQEIKHILSDAEKRVYESKHHVSIQEFQMQALDQQEKEKKQKLALVSDYRECQALKADVEAIQRLQVEQEEQVLTAWNMFENAQTEIKKYRDDYSQLLNTAEQDKKTIEKERAQIDNELRTLQLQRVTASVGIPHEWLEKYEMMGKAVENPVVPIQQGSCGGCFQQLVMQDITRARRSALLQCKKCFRLLYLPEAMEHE